MGLLEPKVKMTAFEVQAPVAKNHVARVGLKELAEQKKKIMMTKSWLLGGGLMHPGEVKAKLKGFESVDPVRCLVAYCSCLVRQLLDIFCTDMRSSLSSEGRLGWDIEGS